MRLRLVEKLIQVLVTPCLALSPIQKGNTGQSSRVSNFEANEQPVGFRGGVYNSTSLSNLTMHPDLQFGTYEKMLQGQNVSQPNQVSNSDTSTEMDPEDKIQRFDIDTSNPYMASGSNDKEKDKFPEQKTLRRLAQNREAARKSRLRKKAYVQQLENSRLKLAQLEQEVQRARKQGENPNMERRQRRQREWQPN